ncbi:MAG: hypothetical protein D6679_09230 [Candidatus Hydrogenedentota bacterium]|nr:MAG: hypothetical protein D6679_09230 [Candidatus Hydrogenedentota bacterium]
MEIRRKTRPRKGKRGNVPYFFRKMNVLAEDSRRKNPKATGEGKRRGELGKELGERWRITSG